MGLYLISLTVYISTTKRFLKTKIELPNKLRSKVLKFKGREKVKYVVEHFQIQK